VETAGERFEVDNVVVAAGYDRLPVLPEFAAELDPGIVSLHSVEYQNPAQLRPGDVLVVGAGNSGADIALESARSHRVLLSGNHPGQIPWRIDRPHARMLTPMVMWAFSNVMTVRTPMGRKMRSRALSHGAPLVRVKSADLTAAGVERVPRIAGVRDGRPVLADGRTVDVANVVWCTGFRPDGSWIDLPGIDVSGDPPQYRGVVENQPGLYFLGRLFQYALASSMIRGVGPDAEYIADHLNARRAAATDGQPFPMSGARSGARL
jgi:putative flavoprotein involved in K+ transport